VHVKPRDSQLAFQPQAAAPARLTRRDFVGRSAAVAGWLAALPARSRAQPAAAAIAATVVADVHRPLAPGSLTLGGFLGRRLDDCIRNGIGAQDVSALVTPFRLRDETTTWRTEFWGKWFTSAAWAYRYTQAEALRRKLDEAVTGLLATQTPDGYLGTYREEARLANWDIWGRKYVLLGLLAHHQQTGDARALAAASRSADHLLQALGPGRYRSINDTGRWNGLASGSILEPVVLLYRATGETRYLELAKWIVAQWGEYDGPRLVDQALQGVAVADMFPKALPAASSYGHHGQSKAYEMMSCYEGLLELHRQTGEPSWRSAVERVVENIRQTEITLVGSGSSAERWCGGARRQHEPVTHWMETCVTATWIKLLAQLHRLGGDPRLVDEIERSVENALLGALGADGGWWSHYSPLAGTRGPAPEQCGVRQNCCVASGPRALALLPQLAIMQAADGPVVNLLAPCTARADTPSGSPVTLRLQTDYPAGDTVEIRVEPQREEEFALRLRVPGWSEHTELRVAGESWPAPPGRYAVVRRRWRAGDLVRLKLDLRARAVALPGQPYTAVVRGPLVLALDRRFSRELPGGADWTGLRIRADEAGIVEARPVAAAAGAARLVVDVPFRSANGRESTLALCDYASAGQTWTAASKLRVWLPHQLDGRDPFAGIPDEAQHV
jgi:DUF1680 family protein